MNGSSAGQSTRPRMMWYTLSMVAALLFCPFRGAAQDDAAPTPVQIVALDECDPTTFNASTDPNTKPMPGLGPDFCKNINQASAINYRSIMRDFHGCAGPNDNNTAVVYKDRAGLDCWFCGRGVNFCPDQGEVRGTSHAARKEHPKQDESVERTASHIRNIRSRRRDCFQNVF